MKSKVNPLILILIFFITFVILFKGLKNSNIYTPNTNLEKKVPSFELKSFENNNIISEKIFKDNKYYLMNIWASWCIPCKAEHHLFFKIKKDMPELFILSFSHKDNPDDSKKYLRTEGDPYSFVGIDQDGKIAFEFGVFGLPETFIINNEGKIIFKHTGPLTNKIIENEIAELF